MTKKCPDQKCEGKSKKFLDAEKYCSFCLTELVDADETITEVKEKTERERIIPEAMGQIESQYMREALFSRRPRPRYSYRVYVNNNYYVVNVPPPAEVVFFYVCPRCGPRCCQGELPSQCSKCHIGLYRTHYGQRVEPKVEFHFALIDTVKAALNIFKVGVG